MIHKSDAFRAIGKTILLFCAFLLLLTYQVVGQEFGGNKPSMKWKQIDTDTVRVIFLSGPWKDRVLDLIHQQIEKIL